jgi:stress-induced morphogen
MSKRETIHDLLVEAFTPAALEVIDESGNHSVPKGAESHFKVVVVSDAFVGRPLVGRHRAINVALDSLLGPKLIHALAIHAYTPAEWTARGESFPASPPCLGGSKHEARARH